MPPDKGGWICRFFGIMVRNRSILGRWGSKHDNQSTLCAKERCNHNSQDRQSVHTKCVHGGMMRRENGEQHGTRTLQHAHVKHLERVRGDVLDHAHTDPLTYSAAGHARYAQK